MPRNRPTPRLSRIGTFLSGSRVSELTLRSSPFCKELVASARFSVIRIWTRSSTRRKANDREPVTDRATVERAAPAHGGKRGRPGRSRERAQRRRDGLRFHDQSQAPLHSPSL